MCAMPVAAQREIPLAAEPIRAAAARAAPAAQPARQPARASWCSSTTRKARGPTRVANVKSVSKSLISALVGIAIDRHILKGVDEPIARFFPELTEIPIPARRASRVEDLLTMRSGLESTSFDNYGAWVRSRNWVTYVLNQPLVSDPGTTMEYSTGNTPPAVGDPDEARRSRARGRSCRRASGSRSGSRSANGRAIRRASTSAGTTC